MVRARLIACLVVVALLAPSSAYADPPSVTPTEAADLMAVYGHTDEGVSVSTLMASWDAPAPVVLATAALVDYWSAFGSARYKFTAGQMANVAEGAHQFMVDSGTWDEWKDYVGGAIETAGGIVLDLSPFWDALGFASLAEVAAIGDQSVDSVMYRSGWVSRYLKPWAGASALVPANLTVAQAAVLDGVALNGGFHIKGGAPSEPLLQYGGTDYWLYFGSTAKYRCMVCGATYTRASMRWFQANNTTGEVSYAPGIPPDYWCVEHLACDPGSEAAAVAKALVDGELPGWLSIAAAAINNPAGTILGMTDAYGIPEVLPPGAIHDDLDWLGDVGGDLSQTADDLASKAASMTVESASLLESGLGTLLDGFSKLLAWIADFGRNLTGWVVSWFVPSSDYVRFTFLAEITDLRDQLMTRVPFVYIQQALDLGAYFRAGL